MTDEQLNFRQDYRARIAGGYNGYAHIAVNYVIGGTALYIYNQHMGQVLWWEWFAIPIVIFLCNISEWFLQKEVMHQHIRNRGRRASHGALVDRGMPGNIKVGFSIVVLLLGVLMYIWEADQGNVQLSWIVIGLSVSMVFAMWIFPETGQIRKDQKEPD